MGSTEGWRHVRNATHPGPGGGSACHGPVQRPGRGRDPAQRRLRGRGHRLLPGGLRGGRDGRGAAGPLRLRAAAAAGRVLPAGRQLQPGHHHPERLARHGAGRAGLPALHRRLLGDGLGRHLHVRRPQRHGHRRGRRHLGRHRVPALGLPLCVPRRRRHHARHELHRRLRLRLARIQPPGFDRRLGDPRHRPRSGRLQHRRHGVRPVRRPGPAEQRGRRPGPGRGRPLHLHHAAGRRRRLRRGRHPRAAGPGLLGVQRGGHRRRRGRDRRPRRLHRRGRRHGQRRLGTQPEPDLPGGLRAERDRRGPPDAPGRGVAPVDARALPLRRHVFYRARHPARVGRRRRHAGSGHRALLGRPPAHRRQRHAVHRPDVRGHNGRRRLSRGPGVRALQPALGGPRRRRPHRRPQLHLRLHRHLVRLRHLRSHRRLGHPRGGRAGRRRRLRHHLGGRPAQRPGPPGAHRLGSRARRFAGRQPARHRVRPLPPRRRRLQERRARRGPRTGIGLSPRRLGLPADGARLPGRRLLDHRADSGRLHHRRGHALVGLLRAGHDRLAGRVPGFAPGQRLLGGQSRTRGPAGPDGHLLGRRHRPGVGAERRRGLRLLPGVPGRRARLPGRPRPPG